MSVSSAQTVAQETCIESLPLVSLHLTERCNSRCVACDYWRHGRADVSVETVTRLLPELTRLGTQTILVTGGEPLIHPQWVEIAELFRAHGLTLWLVTSGLSLAKHASRVAELFQSVTVSLDGTDRETYAAVRGLDAFDHVCAGIRALVRAGTPVSIRVTVQRANFLQLPGFVQLARSLGASQISFLAADVRNPHAFGRAATFAADVALQPDDLTAFGRVLRTFAHEHEQDFRSGFIAESPAKLYHLLTYYSALCRGSAMPRVRCNAPEFSAVIDADGRVNPCFFIAGPPEAQASASLSQRLNDPAMVSLRENIRERRRPECATCVCPLWREPDEPTVVFLEGGPSKGLAAADAT
jgi:MoaA/NifB/PqqE/SkfB family radical SAM enzyme